MPYPGVFKPIKNGNFRVSPFIVNKQWSIDNTNYSSSGYSLQQATHRKDKTPIGITTLTTFGNNFAPAGTVLDLPTWTANDPINIYDKSYQNIIWHAIDHKYYRFAYDPVNNLGASNRNTIEKRLFKSASSFTIPYFKVGESIKPGTVKITDTSNDFILHDDGKGNLRDNLITSQSFATATNLVGYWGFNEEFKRFKYNTGYSSRDIVFDSNLYEVDVKSNVQNVLFEPGIVPLGLDDLASKGYTGSNIVTNGDFESWNTNAYTASIGYGSPSSYIGPTGWGTPFITVNTSGTNSMMTSGSSGNTLIISSSLGAYAEIKYSNLLETGRTYYCSYEIIDSVDSGLSFATFTSNVTAEFPVQSYYKIHHYQSDDTPTGINEFTFQSTGKDFSLRRSGPALVEIDNIVIKEIIPPRSGMQARFDGTSYIKTDAYKALNFDKYDDFAISFWYSGGVSQSISSSNTNSLITKRGVNDKLVLNKKTRKREVVEENRKLTRYPFDLEIYNQNDITNNGKIRFRRSDGIKTYSSASATALTSSHGKLQKNDYTNEHHILAQKSSSYLELWINGTREIQSLDPVPNEVQNYSKLMFGALNTNLENALSGSLDEVRIYNKGLTETAIKSLANNHFMSGSAYQTSTAGNAFYKSGQLVISSNSPKYHKALGTGGNNTDATWRVDYKGTHTIWENEVLVEVPAGHCNVTMNPSALMRNNTDRLKKDFTGSLTPYITTVGLYNQDAQLLAIGKLAQPIAKRSDVDMNFIVRWDY